MAEEMGSVLSCRVVEGIVVYGLVGKCGLKGGMGKEGLVELLRQL